MAIRRDHSCARATAVKTAHAHEVPGPILLGTNRDATTPEKVGRDDWHNLEPHRDEDQVQLDVNRSFVYYPNGIV